MKHLSALAVVSAAVALLTVSAAAGQQPAGRAGGPPPAGAPAGPPPPPAPPAKQPGHGQGGLVLFADTSLYIVPSDPDSCILQNRFKRGQRIGWRLTAVDGGTGEPENTAVLTVHLSTGGRNFDVPARWRGGQFQDPKVPAPRGYLAPPKNLWVAAWPVPQDAITGAVFYTVTATDAFGRTAKFVPFSYENGQLAIVP